MKLLFDFLPIALFFAVFKLAGMFPQASLDFVNRYMSGMISGGAIKPDQAPIMVATLVTIVASVLQILYVKLKGRKVDPMLWVTFGVIGVFGGLTIYLHNENFIKYKPTIIYTLFAVAMLVSQFGFKKNLIREPMEMQIKLPEVVWHRLGLAWIAFFGLLAVANLFVAFVLFKDNTAAWVNFKVFGITGLILVFFVAQMFFLSKYVEEESA